MVFRSCDKISETGSDIVDYLAGLFIGEEFRDGKRGGGVIAPRMSGRC